jgi:glycosyltransferase involved in cell wall biosynthesis
MDEKIDPRMNIVVAHNFYQQSGGEDQVFADETALLESRGHTVRRYTVHNAEVNHLSQLTLAKRTIWNGASHQEMYELVRREKAQVVHFHNTFPLLSPSVYAAARSAGAAVVQTLHNYRLICPTAICYRDGHVCEDCVKRTVPWPAIVHRCYRGDRNASLVTATMLAVHHLRGTYRNDVDRYIALTEFARDKFIEAGLPGEKITVKPNFVGPDPGPGDGQGNFCLFVGRLTESKGIAVLLEAWKKLSGDIKLKIAGDGELAAMARDAAATDLRIEFVGRLPPDQIYELMGQAAALIFPSVWYEGLPKTILESFARGTPVIASNLGSMSSLITPGQTGAHFKAGDGGDLANTIARLHAGQSLPAMRAGVREEFESRYTAEANYRMLMDVYESVTATAHALAK